MTCRHAISCRICQWSDAVTQSQVTKLTMPLHLVLNAVTCWKQVVIRTILTGGETHANIVDAIYTL